MTSHQSVISGAAHTGGDAVPEFLFDAGDIGGILAGVISAASFPSGHFTGRSAEMAKDTPACDSPAVLRAPVEPTLLMSRNL